jgi:hypothetical protein
VRRAGVAQGRWIPVGSAEIRDQSGLVSAHQAARQCFLAKIADGLNAVTETAFHRYRRQRSGNGWKVKDTEHDSCYISQIGKYLL